jgi:hypothetical protein
MIAHKSDIPVCYGERELYAINRLFLHTGSLRYYKINGKVATSHVQIKFIMLIFLDDNLLTVIVQG